MLVPKYVKNSLLSSFKNSTSIDNWFPIWDDKTNQWLANHFGVYTDGGHIHNIDNSFKVKFDWNIQVFRVSA